MPYRPMPITPGGLRSNLADPEKPHPISPVAVARLNEVPLAGPSLIRPRHTKAYGQCWACPVPSSN
jgi:hypothetical protein